MNYVKVAALFPLWLYHHAKEIHCGQLPNAISQTVDQLNQNLYRINGMLNFEFNSVSIGSIYTFGDVYSERSFRRTALDKDLSASDDFSTIVTTHSEQYLDFVAWLRDQHIQNVISTSVVVPNTFPSPVFDWSEYIKLWPTVWPGRSYSEEETVEYSEKYCKEAIKLLWSEAKLESKASAYEMDLGNGFYRRITIEPDFSVTDKLILQSLPVGEKTPVTVEVTSEQFINFGYGNRASKDNVDKWPCLPKALSVLVSRHFGKTEWMLITSDVVDWFKRKSNGVIYRRYNVEPGNNHNTFIVHSQHPAAAIFTWPNSKTDEEVEVDVKTIHLTSNQTDNRIVINVIFENIVIAVIEVKVPRQPVGLSMASYTIEEITFPGDAGEKYFCGIENMAAKAQFAKLVQNRAQALLQEGSWEIPNYIADEDS